MACEQSHVRICSLILFGVHHRTHTILDRTDGMPAECISALRYIAIHEAFEGRRHAAETSKHVLYTVLFPCVGVDNYRPTADAHLPPLHTVGPRSNARQAMSPLWM